MVAGGSSSSSKWIKPLLLFVGSLVISWLALSYYPQFFDKFSLSPSQPLESATAPGTPVTKTDEIDQLQQQQQQEEVPSDVDVSDEGQEAVEDGADDDDGGDGGDDGSSPVPQRVVLENNYETPVDLYWINNQNPEEGQVEYILIDSSITKFSTNSEHYSLDAKRYDQFVLKDPRTNEVVFEFQVGPPNVGDGDFFVVAEPSSLESEEEEDGEDDEDEEEENYEEYEEEPEQAEDDGAVEEGETGSGGGGADDDNSYKQADEL
mmetsp:Transcript_7989/g.20017  ORF Transcript_7989/g.20017 Transcript_7989/m.20017 type:complete len:263 (-) Transcript_7989:92-880(-)